MQNLTDREIKGMYDTLEELKAGQAETHKKLDAKPCVEHGEAIVALTQRHQMENGAGNSDKWIQKNWRLIAVVLGAGVLGGGSGKMAESLGAILKVVLEGMGK